MHRLPLAFAALLLSLAPAAADAVVGRASVVDGDTLDIRGTRIRLHGVDAPESAQTCRDANGQAWRCGQQAALALADHIGSANVSCEQKDVDRYKRVVAVCSAGGEDLNAWLVQHGYALAYRQYAKDYVDEEDSARRARRGVWAGAFTPPWDWRKSKREGGAPRDGSAAGEGGTAAGDDRARPHAAAPDKSASRGKKDCRIKGNISARGERIFHEPGSRAYDKTQLDEASGERWFCSAADAIAAGWRAPRG
ncbi:MAG TPA: thermonuclease family protein [Beijerinckiaceae bacterium]|nr:thermonuclease family protein [Beijerinckiaceae bacterium]